MWFISLVFLFLSTIITLYLYTLTDYLNARFPDGYCPSYFTLNWENPEDPEYKLQVLQDYAYKSLDE